MRSTRFLLSSHNLSSVMILATKTAVPSWWVHLLTTQSILLPSIGSEWSFHSICPACLWLLERRQTYCGIPTILCTNLHARRRRTDGQRLRLLRIHSTFMREWISRDGICVKEQKTTSLGVQKTDIALSSTGESTQTTIEHIAKRQDTLLTSRSSTSWMPILRMVYGINTTNSLLTLLHTSQYSMSREK